MPNGGPSKSSKSSFHFIAGLGSGVFTAILLQPADLLKTRIQQRGSTHTSLSATIRELAASPNPVRQFWRGTTPSAVRTGCGSALYFGGLNAMRSYAASNGIIATNQKGVASSSSLPKLSNTANLVTGAIARTTAGFVMMPVTVLKVRYESSLYAYSSMIVASRDILRTEGVRGFFAGFGATAVRDAPYAGLYVLFYEQSKKRLSALSNAVAMTTVGEAGAQKGAAIVSSGTAAGINFASGIIAAMAGTALTNPFDAIKTRLQLEPSKYGNMILAAKRMLKEEGLRSMFDGLGLRIGRKAMSSALAWTVYEELIRRAEIRWEQRAIL